MAINRVDVFAVMADGSLKLSFTGSVKSMIERHWLSIKPKPTVAKMTLLLQQQDEVEIPMIYPDRLKIDRAALPSLIMPMPVGYVACGAE